MVDGEMKLGGITGLPSPEQTGQAEDIVPFDNNKQAVDIKGYRVLSQDEKERINVLKELEQRVLEILEDCKESVPGINQRSLSLGKTNIQTGFMWAIRAIARPNGE